VANNLQVTATTQSPRLSKNRARPLSVVASSLSLMSLACRLCRTLGPVPCALLYGVSKYYDNLGCPCAMTSGAQWRIVILDRKRRHSFSPDICECMKLGNVARPTNYQFTGNAMVPPLLSGG